MVGVIISLVVVGLIASIAAIRHYREVRVLLQLIDERELEITKHTRNIELLVEQENKLNESIKNLNTVYTIRSRATQKNIEDLENSLSIRRKELEQSIQDCQTQTAAQRAKTNQLINQWTTDLQTKQTEYTTLTVEYNTKVNELYDIKMQIVESEGLRNDTVAAIEALYRDLESVKAQKRLANERLDLVSLGRVMEFTAADQRLIDTLETLKLQYPQLADAFASIMWTKVVQPKFQAMTTDLLKSKSCGIYRIWTVDANIEKSYIGQAKDIRERWSQHIKKMLGVAAADNQKFYNAVKPYNAHFEVVEECDEKDLNNREHYWIEYYSCVENGYNTKR